MRSNLDIRQLKYEADIAKSASRNGSRAGSIIRVERQPSFPHATFAQRVSMLSASSSAGVHGPANMERFGNVTHASASSSTRLPVAETSTLLPTVHETAGGAEKSAHPAHARFELSPTPVPAHTVGLPTFAHQHAIPEDTPYPAVKTAGSGVPADWYNLSAQEQRRVETQLVQGHQSVVGPEP